MKPLTGIQSRARTRLGWLVASEGGNVTDFAKREGISKAAMCHWLQRTKQVELHEQLKSGRRGCGLTTEAEDERARLIANALRAGVSMAAVARSLGVSGAAISVWRKRNWTLVHDADADGD